jgi:hypothetical protein
VLFVDAGSTERDGDTVRYEARQILREPSVTAASVRALIIADCRCHTETSDMVVRYGGDDERLDKMAISYAGPNPVEAGSVGEVQPQLVCTVDRRETGGFPIAIDAVAFQKVRTDPKVPVLRSTAPTPDTFGTPQVTALGHAAVRSRAPQVEARLHASYGRAVSSHPQKMPRSLLGNAVARSDIR